MENKNPHLFDGDYALIPRWHCIFSKNYFLTAGQKGYQKYFRAVWDDGFFKVGLGDNFAADADY